MLKKVSVIVIIALLVLCLAAVFIADGVKRNGDARREQQYLEEVAPLVLRKTALNDMMKDMEKEYLLTAPCGANTSLIFVNLDAHLYTTLFPLVRDRAGLTGIICLSMDELPDLEGKITGEQMEEMLLAGWTYAFLWDGEGELDTHLTAVEEKLAELGLPMTNAILFEHFTYDSAHDAVLAAHGVKYAMKYELGASLLLDKETESEVLHPGVVGWNESGHGRDFLEAAKTELGVAAFAISFETDYSGSYLNPEREDYLFYFQRMLDAISEASEKKAATCLSLDAAYENRRGYVEAWQAMEEALGGAKQPLIDEIAAIEAEIAEISKKYDT